MVSLRSHDFKALDAFMWSSRPRDNLLPVDASMSDASMSDTSASDIFVADASITDISAADVSAADVSAADIFVVDVFVADVFVADVSAADVFVADISVVSVPHRFRASPSPPGAFLFFAALSRAAAKIAFCAADCFPPGMGPVHKRHMFAKRDRGHVRVWT